MRGEQIESAMIVAITDDTRQVLDRQRFPMILNFENNIPAINHTESLTLRIPMAPEKSLKIISFFLALPLPRRKLRQIAKIWDTKSISEINRIAVINPFIWSGKTHAPYARYHQICSG